MGRLLKITVFMLLAGSSLGADFQFNVLPNSVRKDALKAIVCNEMDGVVEIDLKGAFAAGAKHVTVRRMFDGAAHAGLPFAVRSCWSSVHVKKAAKVVYRMGAPRPDGKSWWTQTPMAPPNQKRADPFFLPKEPLWIENVGCLPDFVTQVGVIADFTEPGDGVVRFHGCECGGPEILKGNAEGMEQRRGTVSFRLLSKGQGDKVFNGSPLKALLSAGVRYRFIRLEGWQHIILAWDEYGEYSYLNGDPVPDRRISDGARPVVGVLGNRPFRDKDCYFEKQLAKFLKNQSVGTLLEIRDFKIHPPTSEDLELRDLYRHENGLPERRNEFGWSGPWRNPANPPPANTALKPAGESLVLDPYLEFSPAEIAKSGDKSRFRSTGTWSVGTFDGLDYLEAGTNLWDRYAIRMKLDAAVPLWCVEVTFPDDRARTTDVILQRCRKIWWLGSDSSVQSVIAGGDDHPVSGRNAVRRFYYWPRQLPKDPAKKIYGKPSAEDMCDFAIIVMTHLANQPAAISKVKVYAIRDGRLPAAPEVATLQPKSSTSSHRRSVMRFEDPAVGSDFGYNLGCVEDARIAIDRIAAYMRFTGRDTLFYPASWYSGLLTDSYQPRPHVNHWLKEMCRRFDRDGLDFIPSFNRQRIREMKEDFITRKQIFDGTLNSSPYSILNTGFVNMGGWHHTYPYYNIAHPEVQAALRREIRCVVEECRDFRSFKGIGIDDFNPICFTSFECIEAGYNDYCIDRFVKSLGGLEGLAKVDRKDPLRAKKYYEAIMADSALKEKWIDWRCGVVAEFYASVAKELREARGDLELWIVAAPPWRRDLHARTDLDDKGLVSRLLREAGWDGDRISKIPNVVFSVMSIDGYWRDELQSLRTKYPWENLVKVHELQYSPELYREVLKVPYAGASFHESYYESAIGAVKGVGYHNGDGRLEGDWLDECDWRVSACNAVGRNALKHYASALAAGDVKAMIRGGYLIGSAGTEDVTAEWMLAFRSLPAVAFTDLPSPGEGVIRRGAVVDGVRWEYLLNNSPHPRGGLRPYELKVVH